MSTTQPIRSIEKLHCFKDYYLKCEPNPRNYTLIVVGLNTALRINDLLHLKWKDVFNDGEIKEHILVKEQKTGKENRILLNQEARNALIQYASLSTHPRNEYIFESSRQSCDPLSRYQAYRIIRKAAESIDLADHISCHSLRKTFGYHAWKQGTPPALLMSIFNHSSYSITMRYLCIEQDDKDDVFSNIKL